MYLPNAIKLGTYLAYKPKENLEFQRILKAEDFQWNQKHTKTLVSICLDKLAENWMGLIYIFK